MTHPTTALDAAIAEFEKLVKEHATASYLVSEESHDEQLEVDAMNNLKNWLARLLADARRETAQQIRDGCDLKCTSKHPLVFRFNIEGEKTIIYVADDTDLAAPAGGS